MTVNSYLHHKSANMVLSDSEKNSIATSIATIKSRLNVFFPDEIAEYFIFGSYNRGTILPRSYDAGSDVDFMVVYIDGGYQPQTYLDKLRRFANYYYSSSDIAQSYPTIKIDMNHIRFELVPALLTYGSYQIPGRDGGYAGWIYTDPKGFKTEFQECNKKHNWYIGPTVRLMKYWNATHGRTFDSYELERLVVNYFKGRYPNSDNLNYWTYLSEFIDSLEISWNYSGLKRDRITALKNAVRQIKTYLENGRFTDAEDAIERLLP